MTFLFKCCISCFKSQSSSTESLVQANDTREAQILNDPRTTQIARENLSSAVESLSHQQLSPRLVANSGNTFQAIAETSSGSAAIDSIEKEEKTVSSVPVPKMTQSSSDQITRSPFDQSEKVIRDVFKIVQLSIESRNKTYEHDSDLKSNITELEVNLNKLDPLVTSIANSYDETKLLESRIEELDKQIDSNPENDSEMLEKEKTKLQKREEVLEELIEETEQELKRSIQLIIQKNNFFNLSTEFFSDWWKFQYLARPLRKTSLDFMKEQLINRVLDKQAFLNTVRADIEMNKPRIFSEFCSHNLDEENVKKVTFEVIPYQSESHNRGNVPSKVIFYLNDEILFSVFYKPRQALIDKKIIQTFERLNNLEPEHKSIKTNLFTYKILNLKNVTGASFSLWDFIDGKLEQGSTAEEVIKHLPTASQKAFLMEQLIRAESVCKFLSISDLHLDNIIFKDMDKESPQIVFIDLESIQPEGHSGLFYGKPLLPPFTPQELQILEECKKEMTDLPFRFIPIPTSHFLGGLTRCDSYLKLSQLFNQSITGKRFILSVSNEQLENFILNDFIHNDVPYLTEYQSNLYYGSVEKGFVIASKGEIYDWSE